MSDLKCLNVSLKQNISTIYLDLELQPSTEYVWVIRDVHNNIISGTLLPDHEGYAEIPIDSRFPEAFSTTGTYLLKLFNESGQRIILADLQNSYGAIRFTFESVAGDFPGDTIQFYGAVLVTDQSVDKSHIALTFIVHNGAEVVIVMDKTDNEDASFIDWGDGSDEEVEAGQINATHQYAAGLHVAKIYPVSGLTNPDAQAVNKIQTITIMKTANVAGQVFVKIGRSLSFCDNLRVITAPGMGIVAPPHLPNPIAGDQVRQVNLSHNLLSSADVSRILKALDDIDWPVGTVDLRYNPGSSLLSSDGEAAKQSLLTKGWTVQL